MPRHDPVPRQKPPARPAPGSAEERRLAQYRQTALAWARYKRLMSWMAIAAVAAVVLALIYLKSAGQPVPLHMMVATIAGVGLTVLLGTGLMGLVYFSNNSGHDEAATRRDDSE